MADAPKILGTDTLRQAYPKINQAIDNANEALSKSIDAINTAENVQEQLNQIVIEGDSSVEAAQARVDAEGNVYTTLKERLDAAQVDFKNYQNIISNYTIYPQSPKPQKIGPRTCSYKIIHKTSANELQIIQKTNKGYVHYTFAKNTGASGEGDYGINHELIRLIRARHIQDAYVYKDVSTPTSGSVTVQYAPGLFNTIESLLFYLPQRDDAKSISSQNGNGVGCYKIAASSEVSYTLKVNKKKKANALFMCTPGGSQDVQIFVNNVLVKSFNPRALVTSGGNSMALIEFELPSKANTSDTVTVKIRNNSGAGDAYLCALNFFELKDYDGQDISDYKCFGSAKSGWIENSGASDYALYDADTRKWFGSYHGGEISELDRILWENGSVRGDEYSLSHVQFATINVGEWKVQKYFEIYQQTSLANGKAKMVSKFDFNTDGTIEMDFGYYDGQVNLGTFYTALTCTSVNFNYLFYPRYYYFGNTPTNTYYTFPVTEGRISQVSSTDVLQLDIRFTKFNNRYDSRGPTIADNDAYRKFYYGPIYGQSSNPVKLTALTFSKGLDFIVR
jgi:hypothetical protein